MRRFFHPPHTTPAYKCVKESQRKSKKVKGTAWTRRSRDAVSSSFFLSRRSFADGEDFDLDGDSDVKLGTYSQQRSSAAVSSVLPHQLISKSSFFFDDPRPTWMHFNMAQGEQSNSANEHWLPSTDLHSTYCYYLLLLLQLFHSAYYYYQGPDLYAFIGFIGFIGPGVINYMHWTY